MKSVLDYKKLCLMIRQKKAVNFLRNYIHFWEYNVFSVASSAMYQNKNKAMKLTAAGRADRHRWLIVIF